MGLPGLLNSWVENSASNPIVTPQNLCHLNCPVGKNSGRSCAPECYQGLHHSILKFEAASIVRMDNKIPELTVVTDEVSLFINSLH